MIWPVLLGLEHSAEAQGVNCRLFEATVAGALRCERRPVLDDLFGVDSAVVPIDSFAVLVDRARVLLADGRLAGKIRDATSASAHAEHTYEHRLSVVSERSA